MEIYPAVVWVTDQTSSSDSFNSKSIGVHTCLCACIYITLCIFCSLVVIMFLMMRNIIYTSSETRKVPILLTLFIVISMSLLMYDRIILRVILTMKTMTHHI